MKKQYSLLSFKSYIFNRLWSLKRKLMPRFITDHETVTDKKTGLMWFKNPSYLEFPLNWKESLDTIKEINNSSLYGFDDWKLPNRRELFSIISHETINPALPKEHPFKNVFNGYYWTSSTCKRLPDQAWHIHLGGARVVKGMKQNSYMVWPVRIAEDKRSVFSTGQMKCYNLNGHIIDCTGTGQDGEFQSGISKADRFTDDGHTVTDNLTGLSWLKNANKFKTMINWEKAFEYISEMNSENAFGYKDWRVPGIKELESLIDLEYQTPALPENHPFFNVQDFYWSSTTSIYETSYAWALYTKDGLIGVGHKPLSEFYLWPVRGL